MIDSVSLAQSFPAKTFLLGEYLALTGGPAIVLTTFPCFQATRVFDQDYATTFHPDSPVGRYLATLQEPLFLQWDDPYAHIGGLGASSAQFLSAYFASHYDANRVDMLEMYQKFATLEGSIKPSGYDVLAQSAGGCVLIEWRERYLQSCIWPFDDMGFILLHTGHKLATHTHLAHAAFQQWDTQPLFSFAQEGWAAFLSADSSRLQYAVRGYQHSLQAMGLMAFHTVQMIQKLEAQYPVYAAKGCGAMGSDIIVLLVSSEDAAALYQEGTCLGLPVVGSSVHVYKDDKILGKASKNT